MIRIFLLGVALLACSEDPAAFYASPDASPSEASGWDTSSGSSPADAEEGDTSSGSSSEASDADTDADADADADTDADTDADADADADTDTVSTVEDTASDTVDTSSGSSSGLELDTGPAEVCDLEDRGCPQYERCDTVTIWICPLLAEGVTVNATTYGYHWLICQDAGGDLVCPTEGYHRPCVELEGVIGYGCEQ